MMQHIFTIFYCKCNIFRPCFWPKNNCKLSNKRSIIGFCNIMFISLGEKYPLWILQYENIFSRKILNSINSLPSLFLFYEIFLSFVNFKANLSLRTLTQRTHLQIYISSLDLSSNSSWNLKIETCKRDNFFHWKLKPHKSTYRV